MPGTQKRSAKNIPSIHSVENLIHVIRGQRVMLDADLAALYEVPTRRFNEAVKRNLDRFPDDFMFRLTREEYALLRSQFATASKRNVKYQPLAFTEHGVAMLSAVLHSERAVQMSIGIIRAFVRMRELLAANKDIAARMEKLERGHERSSSVIEIIVDDIDKLSREVDLVNNPPPGPKRKIGYIFHDD